MPRVDSVRQRLSKRSRRRSHPALPGVELRRFKPGPTDKLAFLLVVLAVAVYVFSHHSKALNGWTSNIVVGLLSIAVTVSVVERIVRREGQRRAGPRVERVLYWMGLAFRGYVHAIVIDYAGTHHKTFKPIPRDALEMIDFWLAEQQNEDLSRILDNEQPLPMLILEARDFSRDLAESRQLNLDVLAPELVRVIDDFHWLVAKAVQFHGFAAQGLGDPVKHREIGLSCAVEAAQQFAKVFKHLGPDWMAIDQLTADAAAVHSRQMAEMATREATD